MISIHEFPTSTYKMLHVSHPSLYAALPPSYRDVISAWKYNFMQRLHLYKRMAKDYTSRLAQEKVLHSLESSLRKPPKKLYITIARVVISSAELCSPEKVVATLLFPPLPPVHYSFLKHCLLHLNWAHGLWISDIMSSTELWVHFIILLSPI